MSTHTFIPAMRRHTSLSVLALLGGVLIALQFLLPSVAFAFSTTRGATLASTLPDQALARAEVSVVRLVISYEVNLKAPPVLKQCTGLGALVSSEPALNGASGAVNWVLTAGELVNPTKIMCTSPVSIGSINHIDVFANNVYTGTTASTTTPLLLGTLNCTTPVKICDPTQTNASLHTLTGGAALFTFRSSALQPFADVVPQGGDITPAQDITLTDSQNQLPPPLFAAGTIGNFLNPHEVVFNSRIPVANGLGMPIVNKVGGLTDIQLSTGPVPIQEAATFLNIQPEQKTNALHSNWNTGINKLYGVGTPVDAAGAATAFQAAGVVNPAFKAATTFRDLAISQEPKPVPKPAPTPNPLGDFLSNPLFWAIAGAVLIILLIVVSLRFGRARAQKRQELKRFKHEEEEAKRMAEQNIAEMEARRQQQMRQPQAPPLVNKASTPRSTTPSRLPCPNCRQPVQVGAPYCLTCHYLLSESPSGQLRATPPQAPSIADAPTLVGSFPPSQTQPLPQNAWPPTNVADIPTRQMSPSDPSDTEKTWRPPSPYKVEQVSGRNLSLVVGTRSDPGLKRKQKPNEDSLFAVQGARTHNSLSQQFGLFVVADGMGGHANGQVASRLAIQTIINYMLPKLSGGEEVNDEGFVKLLADGVQQANQAVHQHNQEQRADMGTTMTAALVVGPIAYVANVGDSRTYLYREPEGLSKVTRDHSVVASLVDAGVIKPDDIYTHPKRNQIYRSLGEKPVVEVDTFKIMLQPGDKLLLCSDGLWDMVRDPIINQVMSATAPDPTLTGNALIKAALDGGGEDNVSVIVIHVAETTQRTGITGVQLLAKPDTVSLPNMPK